MRLLRLGLGLTAAAALALPASASAGALTVDHSAHSATYKAAAGEANNLSFYRLSTAYRIQDQPAGSIPLTEIGGQRCDQQEDWKYKCPAASIESATVSLGDGADSFDASNSSIAVTLTAGQGVKNITTGSGADTIDVRNGSIDKVSCGDGADSVVADADDSVDASCENVDDGVEHGSPSTDDESTSPAGDPPSGSDDNAQDVFATPVGLTVAIATVPVSNRAALVHLTCAATAAQPCRGEVTLELPNPKAKVKKRQAVAARGQYVARQRSRRKRRLGKASYKIAAGGKKTVRIPMLQRAHYRYVSRRRRSRAVLRVVERDPAGKVIDVQTRSVTLKAKRGGR